MNKVTGRIVRFLNHLFTSIRPNRVLEDLMTDSSWPGASDQNISRAERDNIDVFRGRGPPNRPMRRRGLRRWKPHTVDYLSGFRFCH